ncbi:MAG: M28 family peptidase, partial [Candidatus Aminicenantes bacterium]|nr:M28 family peptidase [Candidatus Aminicenantes bacterium]
MMKSSSLLASRSSWITSLVVTILIAGAAALAIRALAPPKPLPADAPAAEFSALRAAALLKMIAAEPHPMGVPAHDRVRDTILKAWRELALEPTVQTGVRFRPARWEATRVENILVRLPGTNPAPGRVLMLSTHYDSVEPAPGAADDGAGVVTLLETARALLAGPRPAQDIIFLTTDGEEDGLVGAHVFRDQHPWAKEVGLALNFEARGTAGPSIMYDTSRGNRRLIAALARSPHPRAYSFAGTVYRNMPNSGDLSVFMRAGMQGLDFAFIDRPYAYHTANDNLTNLDLRSLQHHGSYALTLARWFGNGGVPDPAREDAVYFSLFGDVFGHYSTRAALVLAGIVVALVAAAAIAGFARRRIRIKGILWGALFFVAAIAASAGLGYAFLAAVKASHGSWLQPGPYRYNALYLLALVFLASAVTTGLYHLIRRRATALELTLGALVFWGLLTVTVTLTFPDASYLASWPAFFLAAAVLNWSLRRRKDLEKDAG